MKIKYKFFRIILIISFRKKIILRFLIKKHFKSINKNKEVKIKDIIRFLIKLNKIVF